MCWPRNSYRFAVFQLCQLTYNLLFVAGYKSQWPELKGVSAVTAKQIIEKENPFVKAWIYPESIIFEAIICSKRVILLTPNNDCPNGRVSNSPYVG